ncbi:MAG: 30S ribosome-binding factor RbfA [Acidobacteria bacterium]|nr:30S ribosome-binding factor RbfA [Acidobacteriota bacterium]
MHGRRMDRVAEQIRAELAELIENEVADPRVGSVTVTSVSVSPDGKQAQVRVCPVDKEASEKDCLRGLESAGHFLRRELAALLQLRHTPELRFTIDHGPQHARRVETLLERIKKRTPLIVLLLLCSGLRAELVRYEASASAMGGLYTIAAYGEDRAQLSAAVEAAFQEVRRLDQMLSNYRPSSELSEINREAAQRPVKVSPEMFDLLEKCQEYSRLSEGAFDWTVGPLMKLWGFYKGSGRLPDRAQVEHALRSIGYRHIRLDPERRTVSFDLPGMELDPGGIGKGYAVDKMVDVLHEAGVEIALVSAAGSSIYALGAPPGAQGWYVRIRDPKVEKITVAEVYLKDDSLSTSGNYEKFFEAEGKIYSHLMDPRTGYPAQGMLSVSVLAPKTLDSEAWTKPCFVNGAAWTKKHLPAGFRAVLCEESKPCYWVR